MNLDDILKSALSFYDFDVCGAVSLNDDNDVYKIICGNGVNYFLKIYGMKNDYDIYPGVRVYHTYEQISAESEILLRLSEGGIQSAGKSVNKNSGTLSAAPVANKDGGFVTALAPDADGVPMYAMATAYIEGAVFDIAQAPTPETAYLAGVTAARLHVESEKKLLPAARKRPHKRQSYMRDVRSRLACGVKAGTLDAAQYDMLVKCCDAVINCMDRLDEDPSYNIGLVHTDIINGNIVYGADYTVLIDFSRSVYSYYLYDLAEMCLHANFGGASADLRGSIIRGYDSVKPLKKNHLFMTQALFAMFILSIMAYGIDSGPNAWRDNTLKWLDGEVLPGLLSGRGYIDL
jgi:Ser/Thr protein kinase RdoA (MazF antagonist)